jgi:hypothetical protein
MSHAILFTLKSSNVKTGPMPVSTTDKGSCPTDCAFYATGCYAKAGQMNFMWTAMSKAGPNAEFKNGKATAKTLGWDEFCAKVEALPDATLWRHNQAGDLPGQGGKIDGQAVSKLVAANRGKHGFTYTHHNVLQDMDNRAVVAHANANGFTINLSGNNLAHADALADLGIGPVVVVLPSTVEGNVKLSTPKGRKVVVCPATYRDDVTCKSCGLCAKLRDAIVGFPAHGATKKAASQIAA